VLTISNVNGMKYLQEGARLINEGHTFEGSVYFQVRSVFLRGRTEQTSGVTETEIMVYPDYKAIQLCLASNMSSGFTS